MTQNGASSYEDVQINTHHLLGAIWKKLLRIALVTILIGAGVYFITSLMTPKYDATASILVEARLDTFVSAADRAQAGSRQAADDAAIASQIQLLKSRETLLQVVDQLDLRSYPEFTAANGGVMSSIMGLLGRGKSPSAKSLDDRIIDQLQNNIVAARARDSRVIDITYRSSNRETSAEIANALASALEKRRSNLAIEDTANATKWLEQEVERLRTAVTEAENKVANFRVDNDLFSSGQRDTSLLSQQLSEISRQVSAASERKNAAATRSRLIQDLLKKGQALESVPDVRESPVVQRMLEQKANFQASRAQSSATLLNNHPTIQALDAQISDINAQIAAQGQRIAQALETQAEIEAELEKSLQDDLTRLKLSASSAERSGVTLAELEREASAQRDLLNTFLARMSEATARTNSGATFPDVRTISSASVPNSPASPKKTMLTIVAMSLALVVQIGAIIVSELASGQLVHLRAEKSRSEGGGATVEPLIETPPSRQSQVVEPQNVDTYADVAASETVEDPQTQAATAPLHPQTKATEEVQSQADEFAHRAPMVAEAKGPTSTEPAHAAMFGAKDIKKIANPKPVETDSVPMILDELVLSQQHIILSATANGAREDQFLSAQMMAALGKKGETVVVINAGGADHLKNVPGVTDLCEGEVEFGDVIHTGRQSGLYFVPWGTKQRLRFNAPDFLLLVDALSELYDYVVVECGPLGPRSPIVAFADSGAHLILPESGVSSQQFAKIKSDAESLGLGFCRLAKLAIRDTNVA